MENGILYIIGNGFDKYHKINSSYDDWYNYVKKRKNSVTYLSLNIEEFFETYFKSKPQIDEKKNECLWSDFEFFLGTFDSKLFYEDNDETSEWYFEQDIPPSGGFDGSMNDLITHAYEWQNKIRGLFFDWIKDVSETEIEQRNMHFEKNALFLSFNYTPTLEKFYNIPKVFHIHGYIGDDNEENLVFGHGAEVSEGEIPERDESGESNRTPDFDAKAASHSLFYQFQKPVKDIINRNQNFFDSLKCVGKVVVLGHSLNEIDMPYIGKIKDSILDNSSWAIVCYSNDDKQRAEEVMEKIGVATDLRKILTWIEYEKGLF